jgi:hypothetical protein
MCCSVWCCAIQEDRLPHIFARKRGAARCVVTPLSPGLSGTKVVRLKLTDNGGAPIGDAVAKLGSLEDIRNETWRFENHVNRLEPIATPRHLSTLEFGAKDKAAIFFGLVGREHNAFDIATHSEDFCAAAIQSLMSATRRWSDGVPETRLTIREGRQHLLHDDALDRILTEFSIPWARQFESLPIQTRWCCIHGDLHGCNIPIAPDGTSILIDYANVDNGPASLDPVSLELSLLFHPQGLFHPEGRLGGCGWPLDQNLNNCGNIDHYVLGCPAECFIRGRRKWAKQVAAGKREIAACAYSYLIRQLKYSDTDKTWALMLINSVKTFFDGT